MTYEDALLPVMAGSHYMHRPKQWGTHGPVVVLKDGALWMDNPRWESGPWSPSEEDMRANDWCVEHRTTGEEDMRKKKKHLQPVPPPAPAEQPPQPQEEPSYCCSVCGAGAGATMRVAKKTDTGVPVWVRFGIKNPEEVKAGTVTMNGPAFHARVFICIKCNRVEFFAV